MESIIILHQIDSYTKKNLGLTLASFYSLPVSQRNNVPINISDLHIEELLPSLHGKLSRYITPRTLQDGSCSHTHKHTHTYIVRVSWCIVLTSSNPSYTVPDLSLLRGKQPVPWILPTATSTTRTYLHTSEHTTFIHESKNIIALYYTPCHWRKGYCWVQEVRRGEVNGSKNQGW